VRKPFGLNFQQNNVTQVRRAPTLAFSRESLQREAVRSANTFRRACCQHEDYLFACLTPSATLRIGAVRSFKTLLNLYQAIRHHIPKDIILEHLSVNFSAIPSAYRGEYLQKPVGGHVHTTSPSPADLYLSAASLSGRFTPLRLRCRLHTRLVK
jgi:hypothetical protein